MKLNKFLAVLLWLTFAAAIPFSAFGQTAAAPPVTAQKSAVPKDSVIVRDLQLESKLMARSLPYRVVLPADYEQNKTKRYSSIYLLHGLTGHFNNWTDLTKLKDFATQYSYIIVTPEGNNGWYSDSATVSADKYESYIVQELVPEIDRSFRTVADRRQRAVAGLSMGGYGSLKFGLKYPQMFALAGSFSGALQAASFTDKMLGNGWKALTDSIMSVYAAEDSATRKDNDIYKITREMSAEKIKNLPFLYLDCGTEDGLIASNREFAALLLERKIPHEFRQLPGRHDWQYWNAQIQEFLELSGRHLAQTAAKAN